MWSLPASSPWYQRTELRLAAFGLSAVAAVYLGFLAVSVKNAEYFVRHWGYDVMAVSFFLWLSALWRSRATPLSARTSADRRAWWICAGLVAFFSLLAYAHEELRCKILYDEFVVQSTAFNMHYFREVSAMVRGYDLLGVFTSLSSYLDKRPYFFPFLLSLIHDLTGYRPLNAYLFNAVLYPCALGLAAWLARIFAGWRAAGLAIALLGSLPLLSQNATGSGLELLNFAMILFSAILGARYLAVPDEDRLSAFLLAVLLLAQTRYESAAYIGPAGLVVLIGWWRTKRMILSWIAVLLPLLLVPLALHNKVLSNSPILWELHENQSSRFSLDYLRGNLEGAGRFFLALDVRQANSLLLVAAGLLGLVWLVMRACRRDSWRGFTPVQLSLVCFGLGIAANTILIQFYYWASFDDNMSARFALPLHLLLVFLFLPFCAMLDRRWPATITLIALAGIFALGFSVPKEAYHMYSRMGIDEIEWERRVVASRPAMTRLIISDKSPEPWLLDRIPAVLLSAARGETSVVAAQLHDGYFREILVTQSLRPSTIEGDHELVPEDRLPDTYKLELLAERRFGTKITRISRLVAIVDPATNGEDAGVE